MNDPAAFHDLEPWGYGDETETPIDVFGLELALPLAVAAFLAALSLRHHLRARRAAAVEASAAARPLGPGPAVVRGVVVGAPGEAPVRVVVEQVGLEKKNKSTWSTTWVEHQRRTEARPFEIELADGGLLRVDPGQSPRLIDDLGPWTTNGDEREATAELGAGEHVFARGDLVTARDAGGGYRGGEGLVLRPPAGGAMELSTHGLAAPERARAAVRRRWAVRLVIATLIAQLLALPYHVSLLFGHTTTASVVARRSREVKKKNGVEHEYFVRYRVDEDGREVEDEVIEEDYARLPEGTAVPVRVSPLQTTLGPHPTLSGLLVLLPTAGIVALCGMALYFGLRRTAWYETKLEETVPGRLPHRDA